jgi:hypothetical protein
VPAVVQEIAEPADRALIAHCFGCLRDPPGAKAGLPHGTRFWERAAAAPQYTTACGLLKQACGRPQHVRPVFQQCHEPDLGESAGSSTGAWTPESLIVLRRIRDI